MSPAELYYRVMSADFYHRVKRTKSCHWGLRRFVFTTELMAVYVHLLNGDGLHCTIVLPNGRMRFSLIIAIGNDCWLIKPSDELLVELMLKLP
jgi:hypothetical protein